MQCRIFWANSGLGAASVPLFWKTFHAGDCTVHRTDIKSLEDGNIVNLKDHCRFQTDYIILCTGFDKSLHVFSQELQRQCGFAPNPAEGEKWAKLDNAAEETVDELLPALAHSPFGSKRFDREETAGGRKLLHGPSRHYRRLIVPALAAQGDRSVYFPGFIHTIYTPMVSEVQALWGVAFLLGLHDPPSQAKMEQEVAEWNAWSRKRYVAQGRKHAYAIYDFLPVSIYVLIGTNPADIIQYIDALLKDLDINPNRKKGFFASLFAPAYSSDYKGLIDEFHVALAKKHRGKESSCLTLTPESENKTGDEACVNGFSKPVIAINGYSTSLAKSGQKSPVNRMGCED